MRDPSLCSEDLWIDFTTVFSEAGFSRLTSVSCQEWRRLLTSRGVYVKRSSELRIADALLACAMQAEFVPCTDSAIATGVAHERTLHHQSPEANPSGADADAQEPEDISGAAHESLSKNDNLPQPSTPTYNGASTGGYNSSLGLSGLSKVCQGRAKFSGGLDEDLEGIIQVYKALARTCELTDEELALGVPMILDGDAMALYSSKLSEMSFKDIVQALRDEFTSEEQRNRLLRIWQKASLRDAMRNQPERSEVEVFKSMCRLLSTTQRQLHESYHKDRFLKDQIVIAVDIPEIERSLREKAAHSSHEVIQRVAALLSNEPRSAGAHFASDYGPEPEGFYGTSSRYGGEARRPLRWKGQNRRKAGSLKCWVCQKQHRARDHHSQTEIREAFDKRRKENPKSAMLVEDVSDILDGDESSSDENDEKNDDSANIAELVETSQRMERTLANAAYCAGKNEVADLSNLRLALTADERPCFDGIIIDSGANRSSIMSLKQYRRYCEEFGVVPHIRTTARKPIRGIGGRKLTIGSATIPVPFSAIGVTITVEFQIIGEDVPSLLSLADIKRNMLDVKLLENRIELDGKSQGLVFENGFIIHRWRNTDTLSALYTEQEIRRLHRSFGHPSAQALYNILKRARPSDIKDTALREITRIAEECSTCKENAGRPRRFRLTVGAEDLRFNHVVAVDVLYVDQRPVLHVVDEATHFASARFLRDVTAEKTWRTLKTCWSGTYLGPPDFLRIDQGANFVARKFQEMALEDGTTLIEASVESANTMSHVERYHVPLRAAYRKVRATCGRDTSDSEALQLSVMAVNDTVGPEGLCPTLLVFGSYPRPARAVRACTQVSRAAALESAAKEVARIHAEKKVAFALRYRGPYGRGRDDLARLNMGDEVLVYQDKSNKWEGPFRFIAIDGDTVTVEFPHGRRIFRSTAVRPKPAGDDQPFLETATSSAMLAEKAVEETEKCDFAASRKAEIEGLLRRGTFDVVKRLTVPPDLRVHRTNGSIR